MTSENTPQHTTRLSLWSLLLLAAAVRIAVLLLVPLDSTSLDLRRFQIVYEELVSGRNPYVTTNYMNYSPLWLGILEVCGWLGEIVHLPLLRVIQLLLILSELAIIGALYQFGASLEKDNTSRTLLWTIVLNPAPILLSTVHGHFDPLVGLLVLLGFLAFDRCVSKSDLGSWRRGCFLLGCGAALKTIPLVLAPLLAWGVRRLSPRLLTIGAILFFAPLTVLLGSAYLMAPAQVTKKVILYGSVPGYFGVTGLLRMWFASDAIRAFQNLFFALALGMLSIAAARLRQANNLSMRGLLACFVVLLAFVVAIGPGYGNQYIYWFLPLVCAQLIATDEDDPAWVGIQSAAKIFLTIVAATFIVEYSFLDNLGGVLVHAFPSFEMQRIGTQLGSASAQTIFRLPLFWALLNLVAREAVYAFIATRSSEYK